MCGKAEPLWWSALFMICAVVFVSGMDALAYIDRIRNPQLQQLPDVIHSSWPRIDNNWIAHWPTYIFIAVVFVALAIHPRRLFLLRRTILHWSLLLFMRGVSVAVTSLPDPNSACWGPDPLPDLWLETAQGNSCGDLIFSGHTTAALVCALALVEAFPYRCRLYVIAIHIVSAMWTATIITMVLVARLHYTVDVVIAIYATVQMFISLHFGLTAGCANQYRVLRWCERDRGVSYDIRNTCRAKRTTEQTYSAVDS